MGADRLTNKSNILKTSSNQKTRIICDLSRGSVDGYVILSFFSFIQQLTLSGISWTERPSDPSECLQLTVNLLEERCSLLAEKQFECTRFALVTTCKHDNGA